MQPYRLNGVLRASRCVPTSRRKQRRDHELVESDQEDENTFEQRGYHTEIYGELGGMMWPTYPKLYPKLYPTRKQLKLISVTMKTLTLFRPVNQAELDLIKELQFKAFPPRLPEQPIFYPVMNEEYARQISEKWNVPAFGVGYVVKFEVDGDYAGKFDIQNVGGKVHDELWVPSEELPEFNQHIIGKIVVIAEHR